MGMADVGVSLDSDAGAATVYIGGYEFEISSREELKQVRENFEQMFRFIDYSKFGLPEKRAGAPEPPPPEPTDKI